MPPTTLNSEEPLKVLANSSRGSSSSAARASVIAWSASLISLFTSNSAEPSWSFRYLRAQARVASASRIWRWAVPFALRVTYF